MKSILSLCGLFLSTLLCAQKLSVSPSTIIEYIENEGFSGNFKVIRITLDSLQIEEKKEITLTKKSYKISKNTLKNVIKTFNKERFGFMELQPQRVYDKPTQNINVYLDKESKPLMSKGDIDNYGLKSDYKGNFERCVNLIKTIEKSYVPQPIR